MRVSDRYYGACDAAGASTGGASQEHILKPVAAGTSTSWESAARPCSVRNIHGLHKHQKYNAVSIERKHKVLLCGQRCLEVNLAITVNFCDLLLDDARSNCRSIFDAFYGLLTVNALDAAARRRWYTCCVRAGFCMGLRC